MPVIATAGHVDHGKSTLIKALTGRDPDRLEEEQRRGMTIDLGFAWMTLPGGKSIAFVDVPGHRRFIGNMLAGVGPVSSALLVVAADEGWKPQTEEHLAVLDLLGAERVLVALTKTDLVEDVPTRTAQVRERLRGTVAEDARIVPVSASRGEGLDQLATSLAALVVNVEDRGRPSLWVDRVFAVRGAGTVVTGTLLGGSLGAEDEVAIWPSEKRCRVRLVQSHETSLARVEPGSRVGLNLSGIDRTEVERGSRIAAPGSLRPTRRVQVSLRLARYVEEITERGAFHLHVGTATVATELRLLGDGYALLDLASALPLEAGDHFVLRDSGRQLVVAGGVVLDPAPAGRRLAVAKRSPRLEAALNRGRDTLATTLLEARGRALVEDLNAWSGGGSAAAVGDGRELLSGELATEMAARAMKLVDEYQVAHPLESGMGLGHLAGELGLTDTLARSVIELVPGVELRGATVARKGSAPAEVDERWDELAPRLQTVAPPTLDELEVDRELLRRLLRDRQLVRVDDNLVYLPDVLETIAATISEIGAPFTVSEFRQRLGVSRKHAVPLLEYFDREGITLRRGDQRTFLRKTPR